VQKKKKKKKRKEKKKRKKNCFARDFFPSLYTVSDGQEINLKSML
jgi:hypothetical protein